MLHASSMRAVGERSLHLCHLSLLQLIVRVCPLNMMAVLHEREVLSMQQTCLGMVLRMPFRQAPLKKVEDGAVQAGRSS